MTSQEYLAIWANAQPMNARMDLDAFRKAYSKAHERCPICGAVEHTTTSMGIPLNADDSLSYRDWNLCTCEACGDRHTTHDRVPYGG